MYHSYFGLEEQAFSIAVNPRYLYMSAQHREALAHLLYGVSSGGFVMLSGEVGTGKTTIIRCLLEQLPDHADLAVVMNPSASAKDLLSSICDEFGVSYHADETSIKILTDKLTEFLVRNHREGRKSIVLIDEAQLLRISTLEQVRLLTNLETNTEKLLQIILVGQPELNELLAKPALRQLSQRITARYHLRPLSENETSAYIKHRLTVAGLPAGRQPFPPKIIHKIHQISRGIPRLVNILCDRMLLGAYSREAKEVDSAIYRQAIVEVMGYSPEQPKRPYQALVYSAFGVAGTLLVGVLLWLVMGSFGSMDSVEKQQVIGAGSIERSPAGGSTQVASDEYWQRNQDRALLDLLQVMDVEHDGAIYPCWSITDLGLKCENQHADTWEEFLLFNRPAVLSIVTPSKHSAYVTLVGIRNSQAWVKKGEQVKAISLDELGTRWTGDFVFAWRRPEEFKEVVGLGSRGSMVRWLAQKFAELDQQQEPLAKDSFNERLQKRVKIFQKANSLEDDGYVGLQTLLKLNEALGVEKSLLDLEPLLVGVE